MPAQSPPEGSVGSLLWSLLSSKMGSDVVSSGVSLPAWMYEPLTILQRTAEVHRGPLLSYLCLSL